MRTPNHSDTTKPSTATVTILLALAMVTFPIAGAMSTLVTDDPWVQAQRIAPDADPDPLSDGLEFGAALATSNANLLIAAPGPETVHAYEKTNLGWKHIQTLTSPHAAFPTQFGWDIAIHDDTAVIGSPAIQTAYVYEFTENGWNEKATLTTPSEENDAFASSVDIHDDTITIGAHNTPINGHHAAGAIHIYTLLDEVIRHETMTRDNPEPGDRLGADVAIHADTIAAITRNDAAHVFENNDGEWEQIADSLAQTGQARTITLAADTLAVGHPSQRYSMAQLPVGDHAHLRHGSISIYERTGQGWNHIDQLQPHDLDPGEDRVHLGASLGLDATGTLLAAGAPYDDATPATTPLPNDRDPICWETRNAIPPCHPPGAAYLFERTEQGWEQRAKLVPADEATGHHRLDSWNAFFGQAIALAPNAEHIAIGAPRADDLPADDAGATYLFQPLSQVAP